MPHSFRSLLSFLPRLAAAPQEENSLCSLALATSLHLAKDKGSERSSDLHQSLLGIAQDPSSAKRSSCIARRNTSKKQSRAKDRQNQQIERGPAAVLQLARQVRLVISHLTSRTQVADIRRRTRNNFDAVLAAATKSESAKVHIRRSSGQISFQVSNRPSVR